MSASEVDSSGDSRRPADGHIAPVVRLNTRRRVLPSTSADATGNEQATQFWQSVFAEQGLSLDDCAPVEDVLKIVAGRMEAMITGLLYLREGGGPRDLAPDPEAGIDYTGATEVVGLLREMSAAPEVARGLTGSQ